MPRCGTNDGGTDCLCETSNSEPNCFPPNVCDWTHNPAIEELGSERIWTATNTPGNELPSGEIDPTRPFEFLIDADEFDWNGYTIAKEIRKHHEIIPEPNTPHYQTLDIAYIVLKRSGKLIRKFDANVIGEMGQSANFGFYSFLGPGSRQLFISQDTNRGGCQWVVSRPPELRVIFMSGHAEDVLTTQGMLDASVDLLPKPFLPEALITKVRTVLHETLAVH